jgi:hypothetical protein
MRADPPLGVTIQGAIHDQRLEGFAVPRYGDNLVIPSLAVAVAPEGRTFSVFPFPSISMRAG